MMNQNIPQQSRATSRDTKCDDVLELVPAYVVGAADAADIELIESMLYDCPQIAEEIELYTLMTSDMLIDIPPAKAPAHIRSNIQRAIQKEKTENIVEPVVLPSASRRTIKPYMGLLVAAAAILLIMNIFWFQEITSLRDNRRILSEKLRLQNEILSALPVDNATVTRLFTTGEDQQSTPLFIVWSPQESLASLYAEDLPVLQPEQVYQLWVIGSDNVVSGGVLNVDENGDGILRFEFPISVQEVTQFGISLEPKGGSVQPSTAPIYVGEV